MVVIKEKHSEVWSLKNVKAYGDKLHAAIRANAATTRYQAQYNGLIPQVCKENQHIALQRRQARKRGEDVTGFSLLREVWPAFVNSNTFTGSRPAYMTNVVGSQPYASPYYHVQTPTTAAFNGESNQYRSA